MAFWHFDIIRYVYVHPLSIPIQAVFQKLYWCIGIEETINSAFRVYYGRAGELPMLQTVVRIKIVMLQVYHLNLYDN